VAIIGQAGVKQHPVVTSFYYVKWKQKGEADSNLELKKPQTLHGF